MTGRTARRPRGRPAKAKAAEAEKEQEESKHPEVEEAKEAENDAKEVADSSSGVQTSQVSQTEEEAEEEEEANYVPDGLLEEEERLRKKREGENKQALKKLFNPEDEVLNQDNFSKLDNLIVQTGQYSAFLYEQMKNLDAQDDFGVPEDAEVGGKRKKSARGGANKRSKTQTFLPLIKGELRDYQLQGVRWMVSLWSNGMNGILADQMGLGKTIQTIAFLSHLYGKGIKGPFMVLAPLSTLPNWVSEFERFCPTMSTVLYHGSKQERTALRNKRMKLGKNKAMPEGFPVVITSYEIVMSDVKALQEYSWKYIIVDEGHRLKNWNCKLLRELRQLQTANKLILSGTPLQNNLSELWSLMNFLLPEVFSSMSTFENWFDMDSMVSGGDKESSAAQQQRSQVLGKLHQVLKPFLLRRIKSDVETSLPAKREMILYAHMTPTQKKYNEELRKRTLNDMLTKQQQEEGGRKVTKTKLNNMIMQMRKNCNHPDLVTSAFTNDVMYPTSDVLLEQSGKLQLLNRLLKKLKAKGHRVLIFSQMTKMLDLLDTFLEQEGHASCRLDGSVKWQDRRQALDDFKGSSDLFVFLLSTRAGGLGINLTQADTVIIYDSDWNPHQDLQAMDRAHRIGQDKPVLVIRLAAANSVDGRMLKRANSKLMLERLVIRKGAFMAKEQDTKASSLSHDELMELLKDTIPLKDEPQSGVVSDKMMDTLLDRSHLVTGKPAPYADAGVGYEVVSTPEGQGGLADCGPSAQN